jgi:hypothetical protein
MAKLPRKSSVEGKYENLLVENMLKISKFFSKAQIIGFLWVSERRGG